MSETPEYDPAPAPPVTVPVPRVSSQRAGGDEPQEPAPAPPSGVVLGSSRRPEPSLLVGQKPNALATASMVMGFAAFVLFGFSPLGWSGVLSPIVAIGAVVAGFVSRREIKRYGGIGIGRSIAGIVSGSVLLIVFVLFLVAFILLLNEAWSGG